MKWKRRCFETACDIRKESQAILDRIKANGFYGASEARVKKWNRSIRSHEDYLEGHGNHVSLLGHPQLPTNNPRTYYTQPQTTINHRYN
jgi:hypothetical protein